MIAFKHTEVRKKFREDMHSLETSENITFSMPSNWHLNLSKMLQKWYPIPALDVQSLLSLSLSYIQQETAFHMITKLS